MNSRASRPLVRLFCCPRQFSLRELGFRCDYVTRCQSTSIHNEPGPSAPFHEPFRKQLRLEARQKKLAARSTSLNVQKGNPGIIQESKSERAKELVRRSTNESGWELTVGIEIHAELDTERKLFSTAGTSINDTPNSNITLCDLAYPGAQPLFQPATLLPALRAALALNCRIERKSSFDRKHYFYQDQPAGYQITQYYEPFAKNGSVVLFPHDGIAPEDGDCVQVNIKQVQMEQDTAKSLVQPGSSTLLDFNRVSHPLIEIITLPEIHHPTTAAACVRKIQAILKSVGAVTAGMEMGGLRADVNVSVRRTGSEELGNDEYEEYGLTGLGQRTEIKNLSSFKAVEDAIIAERDRQIQVLEAGGKIVGETRGWTLGSTETHKLRGKEGEVDYRYMPDPDLGPLLISPELIETLQATLPMTPDATLSLLQQPPHQRLSMKDAMTLLSLDDGDRVDYYMDVLDQLRKKTGSQKRLTKQKPGLVGNWVIHELGTLVSNADIKGSWDTVPSAQLAEIIYLVDQEKITSKSARDVLKRLFSGDPRSVQEVVADENLLVVELNDEVYRENARKVFNIHQDVVAKATAKDVGKVNHLVGQMIRQMASAGLSGAVQPAKAKQFVLEELSNRSKNSERAEEKE